MDREELAWAAGFYDGEGTFCLLARRSHGVKRLVKRKPWAMLSQSGEDGLAVLERFREALGGLGSIYGPYRHPQYPNAKPIWKWNVGTDEKVQAVIAMLWRWLSEPKRADARRVLRYRREWIDKNNQGNPTTRPYPRRKDDP